MEKRRRRILFEARRFIAKGEFDQLTTRGLANAAGISQPTLYNLIGSKEDILRALIKEAFDRIVERFHQYSASDPLDAIEALVIESSSLYAEDETFYRAAGIASDRLIGPIAANAEAQDQQLQVLADQVVGMARDAVASAIEAGLLQGRINSDVLSEQLYICYRGPHRDWVYGLISIETYRMRALRGFYMTLAADASPAFRTVLEEKILALTEPRVPGATKTKNA